MGEPPKGTGDFNSLRVSSRTSRCREWANRRKALETHLLRVILPVVIVVVNGRTAERHWRQDAQSVRSCSKPLQS